MSFLSGLKKVVAATSTGGLSLLAPPKVQEQIGNVVGIGSVVGGAAALTGGSSLGASLGSSGNVLTAGTQALGGLLNTGLQKIGIGAAAAPPDAGSPPSGSTGVLEQAGAFLKRVAGTVPFPKAPGTQTVPQAGGLGSGMGAGISQFGGGFMPTSFTGSPDALGLTTGGPAADQVIPGMGMGMPIPVGSGGVMPVAGAMPRMIGALVMGAKNLVKGIMTPGGFVSAAKVAELAEKYGLQIAAGGLGVSLAEVAMTLVSHHSHKRKRRHRGISGRDLKTTRRTVGKIFRMHHMLSHLCSTAHLRARARAPRAVGFARAPTTIVQH